jgi:fructosamine-3-kinase
MIQDSDIPWAVLRRIVQEWAGASAELAEVKPLEGGFISTTLALTLKDGQKAVLKISAHRVDHSYQRQAHQLELLHKAGIPAPKVYAAKVGSLDNPYSYLLMEFVEGSDWATARKTISPEQFDHLQEHLAELLKKLHAATGETYGRATPNQEDQFDRWPGFYRHIFEPIWRDLEKSHLIHGKQRKLIKRVWDNLDYLLAHQDRPRLVHWDLWSSNMLAREEDGKWRVAALLDPNCKFAHVEAELAYLELFHTVGPTFMKAYQRDKKLGDEYHRVRKPVYQLHYLMNHVLLFGEQYSRPLSAALDRCAALV